MLNVLNKPAVYLVIPFPASSANIGAKPLKWFCGIGFLKAPI